MRDFMAISKTTKQYFNCDVTATAKNQMKPEQKGARNLYRDVCYAIQGILGKSRSTMGLI